MAYVILMVGVIVFTAILIAFQVAALSLNLLSTANDAASAMRDPSLDSLQKEIEVRRASVKLVLASVRLVLIIAIAAGASLAVVACATLLGLRTLAELERAAVEPLFIAGSSVLVIAGLLRRR